ncbi:DgyrCDS12588 [Dimorphilus gyrociliatus]|uniref:DgyrCDS12588 n=1 Tax=Dimorphilus gyrociliatus TaxID=2664684 RepID=A0A7I8W864_9ANNE|nr:DgyrCDS12588 [Dimorphilus gyrociliatus]
MIEFEIEPRGNSTFVAKFINKKKNEEHDDVGALYYVVVVILLYACSMIMMIASHIRKNKIDRKLNVYLKEMAFVRKRERQLQLLNTTNKLAEFRGTDGRVVKNARVALSEPNQLSSFEDLDEQTEETCFISPRQRENIEIRTTSIDECPSSTVVLELNDAASDTEIDVYGETP